MLRGINVGGNKKVPMAQLRALLGELGHRDAKTYLNSGNAVFDSDDPDETSVARELEQALESRFGFAVPCLVRTGDYLRAIAAACPFPADEIEGKQLHAIFYSAPADPERFADIDRKAFLPEEFRLGDRVLYLHVPNGLGRSELAAVLSRSVRLKGIDATARNWNTVRALIELT
jgi:uncharacterized protein (DUF1697 family)